MTPLVFHALFSLAEAPVHAYGVMKDIIDRTGGRVEVAPGSLHFTLQRLADAGLIEGATAPKASARADARRRYYRLTPAGRTVLRSEVKALEDIVALARQRRVTGKG
jgi:DNA-binding PadR family transcriptional regulator